MERGKLFIVLRRNTVFQHGAFAATVNGLNEFNEAFTVFTPFFPPTTINSFSNLILQIPFPRLSDHYLRITAPPQSRPQSYFNLPCPRLPATHLFRGGDWPRTPLMSRPRMELSTFTYDGATPGGVYCLQIYCHLSPGEGSFGEAHCREQPTKRCK